MLDEILTEKEILAAGKLNKFQVEMILSKARVRVAAISRQSGKSLTLRTICLKELLECPGLNILYLGPTHRQVQEIGFRPMFLTNDPIFPPEMLKYVNKSEMAAETIYGSRIVFAGTEALDRLRGLTVDLLILDEYAFMSSDVLTALEPVVSARNGRIVIASTPKGRNHFYEVVERGKLDSTMFTPGYRSWVIPFESDELVLPNKELRMKNAKDTLSPQAYAQEYGVRFDAASGLVYKSFDIEANKSSAELDKKKAMFIGMDFNVSKMVAVIGQKNDKELHIIDELVLYDTNTEEMAKELNKKYQQQFAGRMIIVPDASGSSRKTSSNGNTDHSILTRHGFTVNSPRKNPDIMDRVNAVNAMLCSASGIRRLFIHPRCVETIKALTAQVIDPKTNQPEKGSGSTDISAAPDALGYLVNRYYPIVTNQVVVGNALGYT